MMNTTRCCWFVWMVLMAAAVQQQHVVGGESLTIEAEEEALLERPLSTTRIVGGTVVEDRTRYPYFALLGVTLTSGTVSRCGGALIHDDIVLTVAHCGLDVATMEIRVNVTFSSVFLRGSHLRTPVAFAPHELYNRDTNHHDLMLIKLNQPVPDTVPKLRYNRNDRQPRNHTPVTVMGFGSQSVSGRWSGNLRQVQVRVVDFDNCNDANSYAGRIDDSIQLCAGVAEGGKDACVGDSGGPLIVRGPSSPAQDVLVGIVSYGIGCGLANYPGVYTRISTHADWIERHVCALSAVPPITCGGGQNPHQPPQDRKSPLVSSQRFVYFRGGEGGGAPNNNHNIDDDIA